MFTTVQYTYHTTKSIKDNFDMTRSNSDFTNETTLETIDNVSAYFQGRSSQHRTARSSGISSPPSRRGDERDNEVTSMLKNLAYKESPSPRSLLDLEKVKTHNTGELDSQHENYVADKEDNENTFGSSRRWLEERKKSSQLPRMMNEGSNTNLQYSEGVINPPPEIDRRRNDFLLKSLQQKGRHTRKYGSSPPKYIYNSTIGEQQNTCTEESKALSSLEGKVCGNNFPEHPFPRSQQQWSPSRSGLFPSSFDTVLSGYGSLDYSSEDQSLDTRSRVSNKDLVEENISRKPRHNAKGRQYRSKSFSSTDSPEQRLPLVPEIPSLRSEKNTPQHESQPLLGKPLPVLRPRVVEGSKSPCKKFPRKRDRQTLVASLIDEVRGYKQSTSCRDFAFAVLFYAQITVIIITGAQYGPQAFGYIGTGKDDVTIETGVVLFTYRNVIILTLGCGIISISISSLMLLLMTNTAIVQVALFMTMSLALMWSFIGMLFSPQTFVPVMGLVSFGVSVGYTFTVWDRIPFVTAQLNTALAAIKESSSLIALACVMQVIALIGIILYFITCIGIYDYFQVDNHQLSQRSKFSCYVGLAISFTWTFQVLLHVLKATTCGVVNHWWFSTSDKARSWDSFRESFLRAGFWNFGSICLGSLFIGPANFLANIAGHIRPNKEEAAIQIFVVVQEWIVSAIDFVCMKFNNWAFAYVGMYGYSYFEAGENAEQLFRRRGWQEIIGDDLLGNVLFAFSIVIGGVIGCIAVLIEDVEKTRLYSLDYPSLVAFIIGAVVGLVLSNVLFCIISSSVDAVIICFAGSPDEFVRNHPSNSHEMRSAWREAWPGTVDFVQSANANALTKSPSSLISQGPNYLLGGNRQKLDVIFV